MGDLRYGGPEPHSRPKHPPCPRPVLAARAKRAVRTGCVKGALGGLGLVLQGGSVDIGGYINSHVANGDANEPDRGALLLTSFYAVQYLAEPMHHLGGIYAMMSDHGVVTLRVPSLVTRRNSVSSS